METSVSRGPEGTRPTVEFVEDVVDLSAFHHPAGRRLDELMPDELLGVAFGATDRSLLPGVANVASVKALEFLDTDIDLFELWIRVADAIGDIYESEYESGDGQIVDAMITARTETGELVL